MHVRAKGCPLQKICKAPRRSFVPSLHRCPAAFGRTARHRHSLLEPEPRETLPRPGLKGCQGGPGPGCRTNRSTWGHTVLRCCLLCCPATACVFAFSSHFFSKLQSNHVVVVQMQPATRLVPVADHERHDSRAVLSSLHLAQHLNAWHCASSNSNNIPCSHAFLHTSSPGTWLQRPSVQQHTEAAVLHLRQKTKASNL